MSDGRQSMERAIEGLGEQIRFALEDPDVPGHIEGAFDSVEVAAMGGSALAWDVLDETLGHRLEVPLRVHRDYCIGTVSPRALGIACSISGNTEETLVAFDLLRETCQRAIAITAGGALARRASATGVPVLHVPVEREPPGFQPRSSVGYVLAYAARILDAAGLSTGLASEVAEARADYGSGSVRADAEKVAHWMDGGIPVIYASAARERSLARIMKIKINENAKYPAFAGTLPEGNHNEMIGFESTLAPFRILYIADPSDAPEIGARFETMTDIFAERGLSHVETRRHDLRGVTPLGRVLSGITFGDWCSYELATLRGVDPTPVELVEAFKAKLRDRQGGEPTETG